MANTIRSSKFVTGRQEHVFVIVLQLTAGIDDVGQTYIPISPTVHTEEMADLL